MQLTSEAREAAPADVTELAPLLEARSPQYGDLGLMAGGLVFRPKDMIGWGAGGARVDR